MTHTAVCNRPLLVVSGQPLQPGCVGGLMLLESSYCLLFRSTSDSVTHGNLTINTLLFLCTQQNRTAKHLCKKIFSGSEQGSWRWTVTAPIWIQLVHWLPPWLMESCWAFVSLHGQTGNLLKASIHSCRLAKAHTSSAHYSYSTRICFIEFLYCDNQAIGWECLKNFSMMSTN